MRKALTTEQGKGEMEARITQLEGTNRDLERQVSGTGTASAPHAASDCGQAGAATLGPWPTCCRSPRHPTPPPQVQEWKLKCEAIEKREAERRDAEAKKHKEEVAYLDNYARQLKGQLEAFVTPAKKGAAGALGGQQALMSAA
jgi:dynein light intermediate chain